MVYGQEREAPVLRRGLDAAEVAAEQRRFREAAARAADELAHVRDQVRADFGEPQAEIFEAHLMLLRDAAFIDKVCRHIGQDHVNAEHALDDELRAAERVMTAAADQYLSERVLDLKDVGHRLLRQLAPAAAGALADLPPGSIIVARELLPSDLIALDRRHVAGIVTERGGPTTHCAILARALGIPAVSGIPGAATEIPRGAHVLIDGETGDVTMAPSAGESEAFAGLKRRYDRSTAEAVAAEALECVTLDGVRVTLRGNIGRPGESAEVHRHRLQGVGLFRTEFLFLDEPEPPSFERQLSAYRDAAAGLGGLPLVIRTLDLGGDKTPAFLQPQAAANPMLGLRGLRFSLHGARALFDQQLRAIARAAGDHDVRVLFPMVLGASDLRQAIEALDRAKAREGVTRRIPVGAMIETPSSLFSLDQILALAEFVSIGTNDLTQFMLAADRNLTEGSDEHSVLYPSVLRAVAMVAAEASRRHRPACVCGEDAGDTAIACLLVGLGLRELSMSPFRAARVRYTLRRIRLSEMEILAQRALQEEGPEGVRALLAGTGAPAGD